MELKLVREEKSTLAQFETQSAKTPHVKNAGVNGSVPHNRILSFRFRVSQQVRQGDLYLVCLRAQAQL